MATIKVKYGGCGIKYTDANDKVRHALKTPEDGPFECDDAQAERLIGLGVAEYVGLQWKKYADTEPQPDDQPEETGEPEQITGRLDAAQLEKMGYNELKKLAAELGVVPESTKKADYIKAIAAAEVEVDDEEDLDDDLPELSAADPE